MVPKLALICLGFFVFAFLFWRKLKEDYLEQQIFSSVIIVLVGVWAASFLASKLWPSWWFWFSFLGLTLGLGLAAYRFKLRFYETYEAGLVAGLPWLSATFFYDGLKNSSWFSLAYFIFILLFLVVYSYLNLRYKNFGWYKSGRIGFAGLTTLGIFFLTRGLIAILFPFMLSFSGSFEAIVSGIAAFLAFLAVFDLSRKT